MDLNHLQNDSSDRRLVPTVVASKAKSLALTLTDTVAETRDYIRTDEFRWRALITTGRYATHSMVVMAGILSIILASFKINTAAPAVTLTATPNNHLSRGAQTATGNLADSGMQTVALTGPGIGGSSSGQTLFKLDRANPSQPGVVGTTIAQGLSPYIGISNVDSGLLSEQIALAATEEKPVQARAEIQTYTVQTGDTIEGIAARFNLQPTTLIWSNDAVEKSPDSLQVGQVLKILPTNGIYYTVQSNDSLNGIADKFKAKIEDILASSLNNLQTDTPLQPGMQIVIPSGVKEWKQQVVVQSNNSNAGSRASTSYAAPVAPTYNSPGNFGWPTAASTISQGFWWGHRALDIAQAVGVPIYASESGYISYAGWNYTGYGNMITINHGSGFESLYGHLSEWYVDPGQYVSKGQLIGAMGSTGNSTGPHLHFEIRVNGVPSNPYFYLQ